MTYRSGRVSLHPRKKDISKKRFYLTGFVGQNFEMCARYPDVTMDWATKTLRQRGPAVRCS